jgi:hypothetical protein
MKYTVGDVHPSTGQLAVGGQCRDTATVCSADKTPVIEVFQTDNTITWSK